MRRFLIILALAGCVQAADPGTTLIAADDISIEVAPLGTDTVRVAALSDTSATKQATNIAALRAAALAARDAGFSVVQLLGAGPQGVDVVMDIINASPDMFGEPPAPEPLQATVLAVKFTNDTGPYTLGVAAVLDRLGSG